MRRSCSCTPTGSRAAAEGEDARLASVSGGARRPRHLLRPEHAHNLEMRDVLEADRHAPGQGRSRRRSAEIQRYTKLFWINTGPYNNLTARKFVLKLHARGVRRRRRAAADAGARFRSPRARRSSSCWRGCSRCSSTRRRSDGDGQDAAAGKDILTASANNLYVGVDDAATSRRSTSSTRSTPVW